MKIKSIAAVLGTLILSLALGTFAIISINNIDRSSQKAVAANNNTNVNYLATPKYMKTISVQKLIARGYSFATIAVDPDTKCEYYVSNTLPKQESYAMNDDHPNSIATATSWQERKTADNKIVVYKGNIDKLK